MYFSLIRTFRQSLSMLKSKDFYSVLGVPRNSSDQDIKSAYFSLAKRLHPDINKSKDSKERFAEISSAYETLGNKEKRKVYDHTGLNADEQEKQNHDIDSDELDEFVKHNMKKEKGLEAKISIEISFLESVKGCEKSVSYERVYTCNTCDGKKAKPGTKADKCSACSGFGIVLVDRAGDEVQVTCEKCAGWGRIVKNPCGTCKGSGLSLQKNNEKVRIPAGVENGATIKVNGKGSASTTKGPDGDLAIKLMVREHQNIKRKGFDVYTTVNLKVSQAVLGGAVEIETLSGKVMLEVSPGLKNCETLRLSKYGIPHLPPYQNMKGDHYVSFQVKIPKKLSDSQRKLYETLSTLESSKS